MQCAWAILPSVACPAVQHFSTLSQKKKARFSRKKNNVTEHEMCVRLSAHISSEKIAHSKKN